MGIIYKNKPMSQVEILCCTDAFEFKPHIHDRYVVWLNTGCGEHFSVKGESDILQPGSISIFEPGRVHSNYACSNSRRCLRSFYIHPEFFHGLAVENGKRERENYFSHTTLKDPLLWKQLAQLHEQMLKISRNLAMDTDFFNVFGLLLGRHGNVGSLETTGDTCDKRIKQVIAYYHDNLDRDIRLKDLASQVGCTEFHLIRLFKDHKGLSPHAFLVQLRLEHARMLLEQGLDISMVALDSGFSDQSHLTRRFKSRYGITPHKYKIACGY
ncbi:transcriptional regulator, AraC family [Desulfocicer vacuolatum DSM 3385]|uniref:Transcriptional regulator, AraC family n=2 Tax=Desulfocicer vacuolatum TaxID=2298 RepID=A0A1W2DKE9_9BACT|nr:transcriptional regulator, AraC family [Desulfocicer vacuolatum DSM 3385]